MCGIDFRAWLYLIFSHFRLPRSHMNSKCLTTQLYEAIDTKYRVNKYRNYKKSWWVHIQYVRLLIRSRQQILFRLLGLLLGNIETNLPLKLKLINKFQSYSLLLSQLPLSLKIIQISKFSCSVKIQLFSRKTYLGNNYISNIGNKKIEININGN